jgi:uncharacterized protein YceK
MRTLLITLVLLPGLAVICGCGTVANVLGPRQYPHYYGGVEFDYLAMQGTWSQYNTDASKSSQPTKDLAKTLCLTALVAADFPLSLAGDTVTLPSVFLGGGRGWGSDSSQVITSPTYTAKRQHPGQNVACTFDASRFR